ncbi:MAG: hypothetical protein U0798_10685 [Gemmataceae bacterium]
MAERWALIVSVGNPHYAGLGGPSHADADALALSATLSTRGVPTARQTVLIGPDATKAVVESKVQSLLKKIKKGHELIVSLAMRQFHWRGQRRICCWDTLADDPVPTSIDLNELLNDLSPNRIESPVCFLDLVPGPTIPGADQDSSPWPESRVCGFASCEPDEISHATGSPPRGLWAGMVLDALNGKPFTASPRDGTVTAHSLDTFLQREFSRRLRAAFGPAARQTPVRLGTDDDITIIPGKPASGSKDHQPFDARRFSRVIFRGQSRSRVKDLSGYRKSYSTPDRVTSSANQFVARMATADLDHDLRETFDRAVREYGYKRKDVSVSLDRDGTGTLRTPDFEYLVHLELDPEEPAIVVWHREVGQFTDPATIQSPAFDATFGRVVDQLTFEFETPWNVTTFVDRFEESPPQGVTVRSAPDGSSCEIRVTGFVGSIVLESRGVTVKGKPGSPGDLLKALFRFFETETPAEPRVALPLPAKRKTRS